MKKYIWKHTFQRYDITIKITVIQSIKKKYNNILLRKKVHLKSKYTVKNS